LPRRIKSGAAENIKSGGPRGGGAEPVFRILMIKVRFLIKIRNGNEEGTAKKDMAAIPEALLSKGVKSDNVGGRTGQR
jgi:hypothetical protein